LDIPADNGDRGGMFEVPIPATLLVSGDGKVLRSYAQAVDMHRIARQQTEPTNAYFSQQTRRSVEHPMIWFLF
jgi:hypothetical protein